MTVPRVGHTPSRASLAAAVTALAIVTGCTADTASLPSPPSASASPAHTPRATRSDAPAANASAAARAAGSVAVVGRVVTMDEPPIAEALLIERGVVVAVGTRDEVLARAGDSVPVIDLGQSVAYPGFIDAHAHWIGDREYYGLETPEEAMEAALSRGWTSISEHWNDRERLEALEGIAAEDALALRVDAYLGMNLPGTHTELLGDWYAEREPGAVSDRLRIQGLKMHLDNGWGTIFHWEPAELAATIGRADDAGWQVSVHTVSTEAHDMVLDAFEAAIGPIGPNPRHHRIDHAVQVNDEQLDRMVAMDLATVVHLDGAATDWVLEEEYLDHFGPDNPGEELGWLGRWRDFVDSGLHVAASTDTPWIFPDLDLTHDIGRPVDQIAGGMDGRGRANPDTPDWALDQLLTAEQGLRAITVDAAYALDDEANRGRLATGTYADITILSEDITRLSADEIRAVDVVATIVGGVAEYCAVPAMCPGP